MTEKLKETMERWQKASDAEPDMSLKEYVEQLKDGEVLSISLEGMVISDGQET